MKTDQKEKYYGASQPANSIQMQVTMNSNLRFLECALGNVHKVAFLVPTIYLHVVF